MPSRESPVPGTAAMRISSESGCSRAESSGRVDAAPASEPPRQIPSRARRAWSAAHCRFPRCPRAGSATAAPASSSRRPTARSVRSPRRHRPSRSADGGSCNRPAATACAGKSRSARARHCAAAARAALAQSAQCWDDECFMGGVLQSCARICAVPRHGTGRSQVIVPHFEKYQWFAWRCSKGSMDDESSPRLPFSITPV